MEPGLLKVDPSQWTSQQGVSCEMLRQQMEVLSDDEKWLRFCLRGSPPQMIYVSRILTFQSFPKLVTRSQNLTNLRNLR